MIEEPKSKAMNTVYNGLRSATVSQLRDMHAEARRMFYLASNQDDSLHYALLMHQVKYEIYRRFDKPANETRTPAAIRKEMYSWSWR